ncbi:glycoside hydrolase family 65 protein [soil metagenome]
MTPRLTLSRALQPSPDRAWTLRADGYDPLRESSLESRFAVSNGFLGVRGGRAVSRGERWIMPPRTYVAGLFDTPDQADAVPGLVPAADWLRVCISTPAGPLAHDPEEMSDHSVTLDMRRGLLLSDSRHLCRSGLAVRLRTLRLVSQSRRAVGLQLVQIEVEQGEVEVTLEASFEGLNLGLVQEQLEQDLAAWRTRTSGKGLAMAAAASLTVDGQDRPDLAPAPLTWLWRWKSKPGQEIGFERFVTVIRDGAGQAGRAAEARAELATAQHCGWRGVLTGHERAWADRWTQSDVEIGGDPAAQSAVRFALYHLNSAANPEDDHVSIGARALTGDDYLGHVFWDTEIFLLPFYTFTWPEAARALLTYRFHTLGAARDKAAARGWRGALYAWESTDTGVEATPSQLVGPDRQVVDILTGVREQHISADVAYAVWQYWVATGDDTFLLEAGAEIILETGRFWASRAQLEADGQRHIRGVIGPDEYHENVDDNAFTNGMARWNLARGLEVAGLLRDRWPERWLALSDALKLDAEELIHWQAVVDTLVTGLDPRTGLFEQFEGYFALEAVDLAAYAGRSVPMDVVLGRERTARSQVIKQADVVALLALLPEVFVGQSGADNYRYYEARCGHGSSLSRALHGLVAARLGQSQAALDHFNQSAAIDLADTHVAIAGGVHIATQGGLWMMVVLGFAGLSMRDGDLAFDPQLPASWESLRFPIQWHGRHLRVSIWRDGSRLEVELAGGPPITVRVNGQSHALDAARKLKMVFADRRSPSAVSAPIETVRPSPER